MCLIIHVRRPEPFDISSAAQIQYLFPTVDVANYLEDYCKNDDGTADLDQCLCGLDWETIFEEQGVRFEPDTDDEFGTAYVVGPLEADLTNYPE